MLEHIESLFSYDDWANREVLNSLQSLDAPPERSIKLLAHIVSAEKLWLERLLAEKQTLPVWPLFTLKDCQQEIEQLPGRWKNYLTSLGEDGLSDSCAYKKLQLARGSDFNSASSRDWNTRLAVPTRRPEIEGHFVAASDVGMRIERGDLGGVVDPFPRRRRTEVLPNYQFAIEFIGVALVAVTGHLGSFLSGVNAPG